jgi:RNA 2',3'-cyclic 3'-phosphodiesterase
VSERPVRSFVAVLLPDGVRARLAAMVTELRSRAPAWAWVKPDNLHLTLRFLGALEPAVLGRAEEAMRVAAASVQAPFTIELGGLGHFPASGPPGVVWAGVVAGASELVRLQSALEAALAAQGLPGDGRAFHPHVTLARARERRGGTRLRALLGGGPRFGRLEVAALHLMRSDLGPGGSRYSILAEAPLADPSGVN